MDSEDIPETAERNWAFIFSPYVVMISLFIGLLIYEYATVSGGEASAYVILSIVLSVPYVLGALVIDIMIRGFLRNNERKAAYIWGIESILLVGCLIFFYYYF